VQIIEKFTPNLGEAERMIYVMRLIEPVRVLTESPLSITAPPTTNPTARKLNITASNNWTARPAVRLWGAMHGLLSRVAGLDVGQ
jgi:hypothetical protein